ncbi:MAG: transcriptional regulator [Firmicutes bacterium]|nr:transcriptional regulator [Bacillota bacterium]
MQKDRFGKHISLIYRYSQIFFNSELKKYNLGSGQYIFLVNLFKNNGINQEQLSDIVMKMINVLIIYILLTRQNLLKLICLGC